MLLVLMNSVVLFFNILYMDWRLAERHFELRVMYSLTVERC
jgi:hypothetical protein